jgi:prepilin-type N-terminal cleavage/methylation domain-containing protein
MASRNTYKFVSSRGLPRALPRGFSFIEVLVVLGLFAILGGLALFVSMDTYRGSNFRTERDLVVGILQHARALAVNNTCMGTCTNGLPHGVHIENSSYTIFQGAYDQNAPTNARFTANTLFSPTATTEIIFFQLAGTTTCSACTVTISDGTGHTSTITVTAEGQITWTK